MPVLAGGGGGGTVDLSDRDDQSIGGKIKTYKKSLDQNLSPKKSHAEFLSHKNLFAELHGWDMWNYHESSDCFEYQKKSLLKSSFPKILVKIFQHKKIPKFKISHPQKPSIIPVTWNLE